MSKTPETITSFLGIVFKDALSRGGLATRRYGIINLVTPPTIQPILLLRREQFLPTLGTMNQPRLVTEPIQRANIDSCEQPPDPPNSEHSSIRIRPGEKIQSQKYRSVSFVLHCQAHGIPITSSCEFETFAKVQYHAQLIRVPRLPIPRVIFRDKKVDVRTSFRPGVAAVAVASSQPQHYRRWLR